MEPDVGSRIRAVREAAGLRAQDVAERIGMDPTAWSKIENGRRAVKSSELARIADALKVSPLSLLEDDPLLSKLPAAARRSGHAVATGGAYERLQSLAELHSVLADGGLHTSPDLASVPNLSHLEWLKAAQEMADFASDALERYALVGDERLEALAKGIEQRFKVDVFIDQFRDDPLSGAAFTSHDFPLLFVNSSFTTPRSLFTLAHELGHLLLGRVEDDIALDQELAASSDTERMANAFAAIFLMPERIIRKTLDFVGRNTASIVNLAYRFGVSFETVVYRLHNLHLINSEGRDALMRFNWQQQLAVFATEPGPTKLTRAQIGQLQSRAGREPARRLPGLLVNRAQEGYQKGIISVRPLAELLGEDPRELLERLSSVDEFQIQRQSIDDARLEGDADQETSESAFAGRPV
jgi:Zn-dependent peptidase ImmA (M78 family)/transcriptional regulator with XRE-family HTH domain